MVGSVIKLVALAVIFIVAVNGQGRRHRPFFRGHNRHFNHGGYDFGFQSRDGTARHEFGQFVDFGVNQKQLQVKGTYEFYDPNNQLFRVNYVADSQGFRPMIEKMPEPTTPTASPILAAEEGLQTDQPLYNDEEGGILDDRIAPNLVKSLVG